MREPLTSQIIDLNGDSSHVEPSEFLPAVAKASAANMPRSKRQSLQGVKNASRAKADAAPNSIVSNTLRNAISSIDHAQLRVLVIHYCESIEPLRKVLEEKLLVPGREVVRYHVDSDSEDGQESENESSEEEDKEDSDSDEDRQPKKKIKPIEVADDEMTSRYAKCLNCKEEFDVTCNDRGDCIWHTGEKDVDFDSDFWADHDERCHGPYDSFLDDPDFAEGFIWSCCQNPGDHGGCKSTKHKAKVNTVRYPSLAKNASVTVGRKRNAEEDVSRRIYRRG